MFLERLSLTGFRCFGPSITTIKTTPGLTASVGVNGSGKTAVMQALLRLFGTTPDERRARRQDFHIARRRQIRLRERTFAVDAVLAFPELDRDGVHGGVAEFFHQVSCAGDGRLKCRLRLEGRRTDDGSLDGAIE